MASFPLSPGVDFTEIDNTIQAPAVSSSIGALAGVFSWGPINQIVSISNKADLVKYFGKPTNNNYETFFTAYSFLSYTNNINLVRSGNTTSTNVSIGTYNAIANIGPANVITTTTINDVDFSHQQGTYDPDVLYIAKYPGLPGNALRISTCDNANAYSSVLTVNNAVATGFLNIRAGSNVATIDVTTQGSGSQTDVFSLATQLKSSLSVGDLISVGNSSIGLQYVQVSKIGNVTNVNSTNSSLTLNLTDPYRLSTNWKNNSLNRFWEFHNIIGTAPDQSLFQAQNGNNSIKDQLHVVVVDEQGYFTNSPGTPLEVYKNLSRATDAVNYDGTDNYYGRILNNSQYVRFVNDHPNALSNTALNLTSSSNQAIVNLKFVGGTEGSSESTIALSDLLRGWDLFVNEEVDVSLLMAGKSIGGVIGEQVHNYITDNITTVKKDCICFASPNREATVNNIGNEVDSLTDFRNQCRLTSYSFLDDTYKSIYDPYNNVYRWVPMNGDTAGLAAQVDSTNDPWWPFAGKNRGNIKNVVKLAFNANKSQRDVLFPQGINPIITTSEDGTILFGDRTLLAEESVFNVVSIRRLFIQIEKAIVRASRAFLWEFNDSYTQAQYRNMVNPYLRIIQGGRGITRFLVICDASNNTSDVLQRNKLVADIYIVPAHPIRNIKLNFVATADGVSFSEVELPTL